jgi:hypothetical protein
MANIYLMPLVTLSLALASCTSRYSNIQEYPSKTGDCVVVIEKMFNDSIGYVGSNGELVLPYNTFDCCGSIGNIIWSPSGKYFIIESYGEGDQVISIYDFKGILAIEDERTNCDNGIMPAYRRLDPYRHALNKITWVDDDTISFQSIGDFTDFDYQSRRGKVTDESADKGIVYNWTWDIKNDKFRRNPGQ